MPVIGHASWYLGPNGYPFISTYSSGGADNAAWYNFKNKFANGLYFVPGIDDTLGYNTSDPGWWAYWGPVIDGVMSWETTWPKPGLQTAGNIDVDKVVVAGTSAHIKSYMMPLSPLQYKNSYNTK